MSSYHSSMQDIYERLSRSGLDRPFLLNAVLPSWWEDRMATVPANRELAELYLVKNLDLRLSALRRKDAALEIPTGDVRFKRPKKAEDPERVQATALIARRAGEILAAAVAGIPSFSRVSPSSVRPWILSKGYKHVDLSSLLEFCWWHGIVVFHQGKATRRGHLLDGMAMFCGSRPVIMLGSNKQHPAWLTFHLAHELAHILLAHVSEGSSPLADSCLQSSPETDTQEAEANRWALAILAGPGDLPTVKLDISPQFIARRAIDLGAKRRIDPGAAILISAETTGSWSMAALALNYVGEQNESAKSVINDALRSRVDYDQVTETHSRFIQAVLD
jgi:IrrE N-terminal-like domain